ncbi:MAG: DUF6167 family protein [Nocardioidaceae bacterium]
MSRVFWFAVGAGSSVYAMVKTRRAAERFTPSGIGDQIGALGVGARLLRDEVRVGMVERESELRDRLGVLDAGHSANPAITQGRERGST